MATTSIWHVRGDLRRVIEYARNEEKTAGSGPGDDSVSSGESAQALANAVAYAADPTKTERQLFVTGINCDPKSACEDMAAVKRGFNKEGGIVAWHGYQSFKPGEVTPEVAHEIGVRLAGRLWGKHFQVVVATHLDKGHLHNHLVLNSVSLTDGHRYHRTAKDYRLLREASDALCVEYGLSVIESPAPGKAMHYAEWQAEREGRPTWRATVKRDVDECIARARTEREFFANLVALGYEYKQGKDTSVRPPGKERYFSLARNFGEGYSPEGIAAQIGNHAHRHQILPVPRRRRPDFTPPKKLPAVPRHSLLALHRHYLYLMGYYQQRGSPTSNARMHWLLKEDIVKLEHYIADTRLLGREGIESAGQLRAFKERCKGEIAALVQERKDLKARIRAEAGEGNPYTTKDNPRYQEINRELRKLRKEAAQCERIEERSRTLDERIGRIEKDEERKLSPERQRKEELKHDRRDRTGNRPDHANSAHGR